MKIEATTTFLDGRDRFEEGKKYDVPDLRAGYFIGQGWAKEPGGEPGPQVTEPATLEIQDAVLPTRGEIDG